MSEGSEKVTERRGHARKIGDGLIVVIEGRCYPLIDISVGGLSFQANGLDTDKNALLSFKLARLQDMNDAADGKIRVVDSDEAATRGEFIATISLMGYIIRHIGEVTGVTPFYFK